MSSRRAIGYRRLRAPREHAGVLIESGREDGTVVRPPHNALSPSPNIDFASFCRQLRHEVVELATEYTGQYRHVSTSLNHEQIVLAGHQPQLFHPGVWFKNFVLSEIGQRRDATAINLLIDNDVATSCSIRVPGGSSTSPRIENVPLDQATDPIPFEDRTILDHDLFRTVPERIHDTISPLVSSPLVQQLWPLALIAREREENFGRCLAQARHQTEQRWGQKTLELPLSMLCQTNGFRWFTATVFTQIAEFRKVYNDCLADYRKVHHLRSHSHPVPDLAHEGESEEAPFWIWTRHNPERRHAFVTRKGGSLEITDRHNVVELLPLDKSGSPSQATIDAMAELEAKGIKIRPRALMTTMFSRLFIGDLFIHGIGGAKYDQLTDAIVASFFGVEMPNFLIVTGTWHLPICQEPFDALDVGHTERKLRDLRFNPDRFVTETPETAPLIAEKHRLVQQDAQPGQGKQRHDEIVKVNESLQSWVASYRNQLLEQLEDLKLQQRNNAVLSSREYSFCLYPEESLRNWILGALANEA